MKRLVDHHASGVIVSDEEMRFFMCNGYDSGYPISQFRGTLNLLGGNYAKGDQSPRQIIDRELSEELCSDVNPAELFAPREFISSLHNGIASSLMPWSDFFITDPVVKERPNATREAIVSCYTATLPGELINAVKGYLDAGKKIVSEGVLSVVSRDDILSGARIFAWVAPEFMTRFLGKEVPNPHGGYAEHIGLPRERLTDYLTDFDYKKPIN